jgi:hypothetical protein
MGIAVAGDLVAVLAELAGQLGIALDGGAQQEEGGAGAEVGEQREHGTQLALEVRARGPEAPVA